MIVTLLPSDVSSSMNPSMLGDLRAANHLRMDSSNPWSHLAPPRAPTPRMRPPQIAPSEANQQERDYGLDESRVRAPPGTAGTGTAHCGIHAVVVEVGVARLRIICRQ